jgi:hypothetical protein
VGDDDHGEYHSGNVNPYSKVGDPAKALQSTDLPEEHSQSDPDDAADNVANGGIDLVKTLAVLDDDHADVHDELQRL